MNIKIAREDAAKCERLDRQAIAIMTKQASPDSKAVLSDESQSLIEGLSDELVLAILEWVPPLDLLRSTSLACKRWSELASRETYWRRHPLVLKNRSIVMTAKDLALSRHQLQRYCLWASVKVLGEQPPKSMRAGSVLVPRNMFMNRDARRASVASSTHHANESIENVLLPTFSNSFFGEGNGWWSSGPSTIPDSSEVLLFTTSYPETVITNIRIQPLVDPFHRQYAYVWKQTVIRAYRITQDFTVSSLSFERGRPCSFHVDDSAPARHESWAPFEYHVVDEDSPRAASDQDTIDSLISNRTPVYESEPYEVSPVDEHLTYELPNVLANLVTVTLVGKYHEQFAGSGEYYACVKRVEIDGISL